MSRTVPVDMHGGVDPMQYTPFEVIADWWSATRDAYNWGVKRGLWGDGQLIGRANRKANEYDLPLTEVSYETDVDDGEEEPVTITVNEYDPLTIEEENRKYDAIADYLDEYITIDVKYPYGNPMQNISPEKGKPMLEFDKQIMTKEVPKEVLPALFRVGKFMALIRDNVVMMESMGYHIEKEKFNNARTKCSIRYVHNDTGKEVKNVIKM